MLNAKTVMVVAPHADDETLGAGGALCRLKQGGAELHWTLMTTPEGAGYPADYVAAHAAQVDAVAAAYPFDGLHRLDYPASTLAAQPVGALVDRLRALAAAVRPDVILLPHRGDAHDDHGATAAAAQAAFKGFRMPSFGVRALYAMEILSETDAVMGPPAHPFIANTFVDISDHLDRKVELFGLYRTEVTEGGPRSPEAVRAQALLHGAAVGRPAAERFMRLQAVL
ncbi:MAG: PIG-L family deacetylase [Marivibrio sp.]|uniref:PIG-L deacetylase family protein n=1 Tax=Marivibrio sp. TaxID=2039719 RepID=UPI0032EAE260